MSNMIIGNTNSRYNPLALSSVRSRVERSIERTYEERGAVLLEAPPASGKSYSSFRAANKVETPLLYLASRGYLKDEAEYLCRESQLDFECIPTLHKYFLNPPKFEIAGGFRRLDGTLTPETWRVPTDFEFTHHDVLETSEKFRCLSNVLNQTIIRTNDDVIGSRESYQNDKMEALHMQITARFFVSSKVTIPSEIREELNIEDINLVELDSDITSEKR